MTSNSRKSRYQSHDERVFIAEVNQILSKVTSTEREIKLDDRVLLVRMRSPSQFKCEVRLLLLTADCIVRMKRTAGDGHL